MNAPTRKIGKNRGKDRIWLEGQILTLNGFKHGMRFDVITAPNSLVIVPNPNGKRKIAGKPDRPIIDMSAGTITACKFVGRVVKVEPGKKGTLILTGLTT